MSKIAVVALDINRSDDAFDEYEKLSGEEKIKYVEKRIKDICEQLKDKEPDAMWVVTWREYGITEGGPESRSISNELKKQFKAAMLDLTRAYPNLTILAGTVSTQKHF